MKTLFNYLETNKNDAFLLTLSRSNYTDCVKRYFPSSLIDIIEKNGERFNQHSTFNKGTVFDILNSELKNEFDLMYSLLETPVTKEKFFEVLLYNSEHYRNSIKKFLDQYELDKYKFKDPYFLEIYPCGFEGSESFGLHVCRYQDRESVDYKRVILSEYDNIHRVAEALDVYKRITKVDFNVMEYKDVLNIIGDNFSVNSLIIRYL